MEKEEEKRGPWQKKFLDTGAFVFSLLYFFQAGLGTFDPQFHRGFFILFTLVLIFGLYPKEKRLPGTLDWLLIGLSCLGVGYFIFQYQRFSEMAGLPLSRLDLAMGALTLMLSVEACRRVLGWVLALIGISSLLYLYFGPSLPEILAHRGYDLDRIIGVMYAGTQGIFGVVAYVFASYVFPFLILGALLRSFGAVQFFLDLTTSLVGTLRGGAAKASVTSSFLLGSVMGSSTANTAITGTITIPLMIRSGFRRHVAGAVEAAASIAGQFMPPVMGAGAFLISGLTGMPYLEVIQAAIIPAVLFFLSTFIIVHFEACRSGIDPIPREAIPKFSSTLRQGWTFFGPLVILISLLVAGQSPSRAAFYAILFLIGASLVQKKRGSAPRRLMDGLIDGAYDSLVVGATAAVVGIIMAAIVLPGLGLKFSFLLLQLSGGMVFVAILLIMLASYVLGMGLTVTTSYLVLATLAAPSLVDLGVPLLTAHLLVFWYSQDATITPPVCLSAYVAAGIAKADVWKTGFYSLRVGLGLYYIPILFVYSPILLGGPLGNRAWVIASAAVGIVALGGAFQGYWLQRAKVGLRLVLGVAALALFWPSWIWNLAGLSLLLTVSFQQRKIFSN